MNKASLSVLVVLVAVLAGGGGYWYGTHRVVAPAPAATVPARVAAGSTASQAMVVEATKVSMQAMPQTITAVGSLRSDESITVRPEVAGRINEILFKEGQHVAKGSTLIRLDPSVNAAEVQQARANQEGSAAKALAGGTIRTTAQGDLSKPTTATTSLLGG